MSSWFFARPGLLIAWGRGGGTDLAPVSSPRTPPRSEPASWRRRLCLPRALWHPRGARPPWRLPAPGAARSPPGQRAHEQRL